MAFELALPLLNLTTLGLIVFGVLADLLVFGG